MQGELVYFTGRDYPVIPKTVAVCPKCGSQLVIEEITDWEVGTGRVLQEGLYINCGSEPEFGSDWEAWHDWHWSMPYADWLPVKAVVYKWFDSQYRVGEEDR